MVAYDVYDLFTEQERLEDMYEDCLDEHEFTIWQDERREQHQQLEQSRKVERCEHCGAAIVTHQTRTNEVRHCSNKTCKGWKPEIVRVAG